MVKIHLAVKRDIQFGQIAALWEELKIELALLYKIKKKNKQKQNTCSIRLLVDLDDIQTYESLESFNFF